MVVCLMALPHEVLVVDVPLAVLMTHQQLLGLFVTQFLAQSRQKVAEFGGARNIFSFHFVFQVNMGCHT